MLNKGAPGDYNRRKIRQILLDKDHKEISAITEALLYAHQGLTCKNRSLFRLLKRERLFLSDRFVDSSG